MIEIREFNSSYIEEIKELMVALQTHLVAVDKDELLIVPPSYGDSYVKALFDHLNQSSGIIFLAIDNKQQVVGLIAGAINSFCESEKLGHKSELAGRVLELIVKSEYQRQSIAKSLMQRLENYFSDLGCKRVFIEVLSANSGAVKFYQTCGYQPRSVDLHREL